ncbi:hypothetical protein FPOAC2_07396 [Fusarium poae]
MTLTSRWNQQTSSARRPGSHLGPPLRDIARRKPGYTAKACAMKVAGPRHTWGQAPPPVTPSTYLRCSDELAKLLVLRSHAICNASTTMNCRIRGQKRDY